MHRSDDDVYFYAANLGRTERLACSAVSATRAAGDGALPPGRYLLHLGEQSAQTVRVWVKTGKASDGVLVATADVPCFPMVLSGVAAIEINVRKDDNDQVAAITDGGTASLFITQISRQA